MYISLTTKCENQDCEKHDEVETGLWRRDEESVCSSCGEKLVRMVSAPKISGMDKYGRSR